MGGMSNTYKVLVGRPEGKKPLGTPSRRVKDNIRKDFMEIRWEVVNWIHLAQDNG
jgi:hypothetical protein